MRHPSGDTRHLTGHCYRRNDQNKNCMDYRVTMVKLNFIPATCEISKFQYVEFITYE